MTARRDDCDNSSAVFVSDKESEDNQPGMSVHNSTVTSTAPQQQGDVHVEQCMELADAHLAGANWGSSQLETMGSGMLPGIPECDSAPLSPSVHLHPRHSSIKAKSGRLNGEAPSLSETFKLASASQNMHHQSAAVPEALKTQPAKWHEVLYQTDHVFTQADWQAHVSFRRYIPEPRVLLKVLYELCYPLVAVLLVSALCGIYEEVIRGAHPSWPSLHDLDANFSYNLSSFALSLLLIFKTNTSYARFWEARGAWSGVYTDCRIFILKIQAWCPDNAPAPLRQALVRWAIVLPYALRAHLLDYATGSETVGELLTEEEVAWLRSPPETGAPHRPIRAVGVLLALLQQSPAPAVHTMDISNVLKSYLDRVSVCERIRHTPIPMPYTRHTTRFILVYTCFMPIVLWRNLEWGVFFVAPLITLLLAGIDNIGMHIENPFRILPMSAYCRVIHENILIAACDWAAGNTKGAKDLVTRVLAAPIPRWQSQPKNHDNVIESCAGSIGDPIAGSGSPATYHIGRTSLKRTSLFNSGSQQ